MNTSRAASIILLFVCVLNIGNVFSFTSPGQSFGPVCNQGQISRKNGLQMTATQVLNGAGARVFFAQYGFPVVEEEPKVEAAPTQVTEVAAVDEVAVATVDEAAADEEAVAVVGGLVPGTPVRAVYYASRVSVAPQAVTEVAAVDEVAVDEVAVVDEVAAVDEVAVATVDEAAADEEAVAAVGGLVPGTPVRAVYYASRVSVAPQAEQEEEIVQKSIPAPGNPIRAVFFAPRASALVKPVGLFTSAGNFARRLQEVAVSLAVQVLREKVQRRLGIISLSWKIWRSKLNLWARPRPSAQVETIVDEKPDVEVADATALDVEITKSKGRVGLVLKMDADAIKIERIQDFAIEEAKQNLKVGDEIVKMNGVAYSQDVELAAVLRSIDVGETIVFVVNRG